MRAAISVSCAVVGALFASDCGNKATQIAQCRPGEQATCGCEDGHAGLQLCDVTSQKFTDCMCPPGIGCMLGVTIACVCADGDSGTQVCNATGAFGLCQCAPPACMPGKTAACTCVSGLQGFQLCNANASFEPCDCRADETNHPPVLGVLDFPDPSPTVQTHVNHGTFWSTGANLGRRFHWDAWLAPRTSGTIVSDGYGVAHALRWGPVLQDGQFVFQGEFWTANGPAKFSGAEGPAPGEWGYHAIDLVEDGAVLLSPTALVFWNGICVGLTRFSEVDRQAGVTGNGDGNLYVMGSPSGGLGGRLAAVRAFDASQPLSGLPVWSYIPQRNFLPWIGSSPADFLADYTRGGTTIPDLTSGYSGGDPTAPLRPHPGVLESAIARPGAPVLPHLVTDPESPYGIIGQLPLNTHEVILPPAPPPAGALVFDSFNRRGQNFVWQQAPTLGRTEAGSLGPQPWTVGLLEPLTMPGAFGIIGGRAVYLEHTGGVAWVDVRTTEQDIRIDRFRAGWGHGTTGIAFRVVDAKNWGFLFADGIYESGPGLPHQITMGVFVDGVIKGPQYLRPSTEVWTRLRIVASGTTVAAYIDDGHGGWTKLGTLEGMTAAANATGAGLTGALTFLTAYSLWRGDNFTVCAPGGC